MAESSKSRLILKDFLPYRLVSLAQNVSEKFAEVYQSDFNLTVPEWRILVHLAEEANTSTNARSHSVNEQGNGISAKDLTLMASMDKSTVSRAVKLMLAKGYLVKHTDDKDKRASLLTLTEEGKLLYQAIAPEALKWEARLLDVLSDSEYRDLMRIIDKLDNRLA
ncbi:MarR family transcriptional regulator [Shewanella eurypsychrophilus]|uniref:MarR family transcriptional regulator n=1 Tax=Shewanella eurypsychrophilus TaxID=2593656 RepID=A0ABX6V6W0_9GAMM|nr:MULTISPECIES: MarR family transcriptional regulator [Shewanella]QFU22857.1 MarR family transcriptional regulator [Shewanella sp. YLB-09]QPG58143.1 MarR family transcriptional regulator [Shewanella eurypsychrophilus]